MSYFFYAGDESGNVRSSFENRTSVIHSNVITIEGSRIILADFQTLCTLDRRYDG